MFWPRKVIDTKFVQQIILLRLVSAIYAPPTVTVEDASQKAKQKA